MGLAATYWFIDEFFPEFAATGGPLAGGAIVLGGIVGFFVRVGIGEWRKRRVRARRALASRKAEADREVREAAERREGAARAAVAAAQRAVAAFERAPGHLDNGHGWIQNARTHKANGAFSPFWSAIETGYHCVGVYRDEISSIGREATRHALELENFAKNGGDPKTISEFPVQLDRETALGAANGAMEALAALTYEAQMHPVFAQIWEQRRTTAAVIAGFANLEQAVNGMKQSVTSAVGQLDQTLGQSRDRIATAMADLPRAVSGGMAMAGLSAPSSDQADQIRKLASAAAGIKNEVYRIGHGKYPSW
ncbi:MAG: hypothetical protein LBV78_01485 [Kitasatospora sp.]|nr:hypothetical protein [Kitasatospora sp.]